MKKHQFISLVLGFIVILASCGKTDDQEKENHSKKETEAHQKTKTNKETDSEKQSSETSKQKENHKQDKQDNTEDQKQKEETQKNTPLSDEEIKKEVAMMLLSPQLKKQFINGRQLLEGQYPGTWGVEQGKPYEVILEANEYRLSDGRPMPPIYGGPEGMRYFEASPPSGSFATIVGVSREYVCIIATQSAINNYEEALNSGTSQQFRVQDLKQNITNQAEINQVMNKITLGNNEFLKPKRIDE
ncbi:hypothetical protein EIG99_09620 [Staphylococcus condimenti]|uniref:Lipoprotein n=2 Tax=Staphylococcus condimenti TaxID=70255 RepID=A0A4Q7CKR0_9STAP|nr:hypothetical protein [Staphylococcus condimenti]RZI01121.1 hypothetical protein EIG99_09620 [Staphylococcus condimenti]RZI04891.1 hypothetical protein EIG98_03375 [Staphylococcus condimenti]